jgi:hypothetical protein
MIVDNPEAEAYTVRLIDAQLETRVEIGPVADTVLVISEEELRSRQVSAASLAVEIVGLVRGQPVHSSALRVLSPR